MDPKATITKLNNPALKPEEYIVYFFKAFSQGKDAFAVLPIHFSKSLIYQLVPFILEVCIGKEKPGNPEFLLNSTAADVVNSDLYRCRWVQCFR